ncbi:MAG: hypothetical protein OEQ53_19885, partial [Saprospiraceae bacterium]|nr:hypothetical protein [Saprospiraceae bacterium]
KRSAFLFCAVCYLVLSGKLLAQDQGLIDSLEAIIQAPESSDSLIAESYKQVAFHLINEANDDRALEYLRRLQKFSEEAPFPEGMLKVYFYSAYYHYRRGRHDSVLFYTNQLAEQARQLGMPMEEARALNRMAVTSNVMGRLDGPDNDEKQTPDSGNWMI